MCGINGIFSKNKLNENSIHLIEKMNELIIHRGPDDYGIYNSSHLVMGMRRLSIIDIFQGHQPMFNKSRSITIVFNGEIYNFKKIKSDLIQNGIQFETNSDTEVILKLYELYNEDFINYLEGMFAFSIYDIPKNKLLIGRDRLGEKPLYYTLQNDKFIWASELKSIVAIEPNLKILNKDALGTYFRLTYIPAPLTIYNDIFKLEPGHLMTLQVDDFKLSFHKYYTTKLIKKQEKSEINYDDAKKQVRKMIFDSVEQTMISDTPIGALLSGGVDSAIIASIMSKISTQKIKTFTLGFTNKKFDETYRARIVANHIRSQHFQYFLELEDFIEELSNIILNFDEPFADSSFIPTYFLSKKISNYVKVVLTGEGGDEAFGGYNKYQIHTISKFKKSAYKFIVNSKLLDTLFNIKFLIGQDSNSLNAKYNKTKFSLSDDIIKNHLNIISLGFKNLEITKLLNFKPIQLDEILNIDSQHYGKDIEALDIARDLDIKISLEGDLLTKVDRCSMINSLETRSPFLRHSIVDYSFCLPQSFLIQGENKKRILKDTFADILPANYFNNTKKGFELPLGRLIRGEMKSEIENTISLENLQKHNLLNIKYVLEILNLHIYKGHYYANEIWCIYCFQIWYNKNF